MEAAIVFETFDHRQFRHAQRILSGKVDTQKAYPADRSVARYALAGIEGEAPLNRLRC
jgi:hypothetical protein